VEAERRQVTVLFADMVGFTSFSERSGEEAAYTLMRSLSKLMDEAVREQGGVRAGLYRRRHHGSLWCAGCV
jgi:class 3 adenylate cyclase